MAKPENRETGGKKKVFLEEILYLMRFRTNSILSTGRLIAAIKEGSGSE